MGLIIHRNKRNFIRMIMRIRMTNIEIFSFLKKLFKKIFGEKKPDIYQNSENGFQINDNQGTINNNAGIIGNNNQINKNYYEKHILLKEEINELLKNPENWRKCDGVAYHKEFPQLTIKTREKMKPTERFFEPWRLEGKSIRQHELGVTEALIQLNGTTVTCIELINAEYKILFPKPRYNFSGNRRQDPAFIDVSSLDFKISCIADSSEGEVLPLEYHARGLKDFLIINNQEFFIKIIDNEENGHPN